MSTFSEHNPLHFENVPLTTNCSSMRNMFSHLVRKDIMGGTKHRLHLELALNNAWNMFSKHCAGSERKYTSKSERQNGAFECNLWLVADCRSRFNQVLFFLFTTHRVVFLLFFTVKTQFSYFCISWLYGTQSIFQISFDVMSPETVKYSLICIKFTLQSRKNM